MFRGTSSQRADAAETVEDGLRLFARYLRDNLHLDDVKLVSCRTGAGVGALLQDARDAASRARGDVFVCGAANCGKSSFINRAVGAFSGGGGGGGSKYKGEKRWGVTASATPGTTLGVVKVALRDDGPDVYDTPGLLMPDALGSRLTEPELGAVLPREFNPVALRVQPGGSVLLGALGRVDVIASELGAFFLTFYVAPGLTLHPTSTANVDDASAGPRGGASRRRRGRG